MTRTGDGCLCILAGSERVSLQQPKLTLKLRMRQVTAVVTQPGRPRGRGNRRTPEPSPVEAAARELGFHDDRILAPAKASEVLAFGPSTRQRDALS